MVRKNAPARAALASSSTREFSLPGIRPWWGACRRFDTLIQSAKLDGLNPDKNVLRSPQAQHGFRRGESFSLAQGIAQYAPALLDSRLLPPGPRLSPSKLSMTRASTYLRLWLTAPQPSCLCEQPSEEIEWSPDHPQGYPQIPPNRRGNGTIIFHFSQDALGGVVKHDR